MQAIEERSRPDPLLGETAHYVVPREWRIRANREAEYPVAVLDIRGLGRSDVETRQVSQRSVIEGTHRPLARGKLLNPLQLRDSQGGLQRCHPIVPAEIAMPEPPLRLE